jgi:predicted DCC family thiol-disulfide oxidoreductase YuxK
MADLILFDGVCGLCNRAIRFVLARDRADIFRFAPLQSPTGRDALSRHGRDPARLDTLIVLADWSTPGERLLERSDAVLSIAAKLPRWRAVAPLRALPRWLRDAVYALVAAVRYPNFGRLGACPIPGPAERAKFVDGA